MGSSKNIYLDQNNFIVQETELEDSKLLRYIEVKTNKKTLNLAIIEQM